jgi:Spy/CpxP family protein refolding chaperone
MTRMTGIVLCAVLVAAAGAAGAAPPPSQRERDMARLERDLDKVALTAEQKQKIHALLEAARKEQESLEERLRAEFKELRGLLEKETPDEQAVLRQADKIGELRTAQHKSKLRTRLQVQAQLTPEQRAKLREARRGGGIAPRTPAATTPAAKTPAGG